MLYGLAQNMAFAQATGNPAVTGPLISAAENEAAQIIRDNFVQPTVNALGYKLAGSPFGGPVRRRDRGRGAASRGLGVARDLGRQQRTELPAGLEILLAGGGPVMQTGGLTFRHCRPVAIDSTPRTAPPVSKAPCTYRA